MDRLFDRIALPRRRGVRPAARWAIAAALLVGCLPARAGDAAQEAVRAEYRLKAGFLYNFARYVEWPPSAFHGAQEPLRLCVFGDEAYAAMRDALAGKSVKGRALEVAQPADGSDAARCHIAFVSTQYGAENGGGQAQPQPLPSGLAPSALKVGEAPDFLRNGGAINLVRSDNRIRFEMRRNSAASAPAGLQFSSQLLKLAVLTDDATN
jgi:hypothetical protein